jgi:hypothetical protein
MYLLYIFPPWAPHTYDFVVLTSLTHPRKIILVVLQELHQKYLTTANSKVMETELRLLRDRSIEHDRIIISCCYLDELFLTNHAYKNEFN